MDLTILALKLSGLNPIISKSENWIFWHTSIKPTTCVYCAEQNGKIFNKTQPPNPKPPVHVFCGCVLNALSSILAGTATYDGANGADYWLKKYNQLPSNYITKEDAKKLGWNIKKGNLSEIAPDTVLGGGKFYNNEGYLPDDESRIWYEADINYTGGYRNKQRVLYSNDGLIFVTYDHYKTFYEITVYGGI